MRVQKVTLPLEASPNSLHVVFSTPGTSSIKMVDAQNAYTFSGRYSGQTVSVSFSNDPLVWPDLAAAIASATGTDAQTLKLIGVKNHKGALHLRGLEGKRATEAGLPTGVGGIMILGSKAKDVEALQAQAAQEAKLRLPSFEHANLVMQRRRAPVARDVGPPKRMNNTFREYQVLPEQPGMYPPPSEALKLLHRLASDPGIMHIMEIHNLDVGILAEMPPNIGRFGVDPVCLLGLNTNAGQKIELRLRTDDVSGFRKYDRILDTLIHELTHNTFGDHDNNFKALCSQYRREVQEVHARMEHPGHRVLSAGIQEWSLGRYTGGSLSSDQAEPAQGPAVHAAMAASAASSGKTLRQLAREGGGARPVGVGTTGGAAGTTIGSLQGLHLGQGPSQGGAAVGTSASRTAAGSANLSQRSPGGAGTSSPSSSATQQGRGSSQSPPSGSPGPQQEDDVAVMYEHTDAETERLEKLQRQLEGDG